MADIKQAAKWMLEGKNVKRTNPKEPPEENLFIVQRPASNDGSFRESRGFVVGDAQHKIPVFSIEALLADDWEIA